jgi:hypothetical protein
MSEAIGATLALLLMAAASRAEQPCPWLNAATAAGVLGGDVKSQISEDSCTFTHDSSQLRIELRPISPPYKLDCGPNATPLNAIGNEAISCSLHGNNGRMVEKIAGRVRDRAFFIRMTSTDIARDAIRDKARLVAEQVAGILF